MEKIVVIKLGSNVLMKDGLLDESVISNVVENIAALKKQGLQIVLVSSGAMACGREYLGKHDLQEKDPVIFAQACSSLGQPLLMKKYIQAFDEFNIKAAQALLTQDSFTNIKAKISLTSVLSALIQMNVVPIINENDVLTSEEIVFSDNDLLAAHIAGLLQVQTVVLLTNVDGLYSAHPDEGGELMYEIEKVTEEIYEMASEKKSLFGRGGMRSKIEAADILTREGIEMILANGKKKDVLLRVMKGEKEGTRFFAQ